MTAPRASDVWHRVVWIVAGGGCLVAIFFLVPGLASVRRDLSHGRPEWLALAACFRLASALAYVVLFRAILAPDLTRRMSYRIGMSEIGLNALLPAGGTGGLAVGGWALHRLGTPTKTVVERSATLFVFTSAFSVGAVAVLGWLGGIGVVSVARSGAVLALTLVPAFVATAVIVLAIAVRPRLAALQAAQAKYRTHGVRWWLVEAAVMVGTGASGALKLFSERDPRALLGGAAYLLFDIAALWATIRGFHGHTRTGSLAMSYLLGQLAGDIPIPGGIGAISGGLIGALSLYGLPLAVATASTLAYQAIALVVPLLLGVPAILALAHTLGGLRHSAGAPTAASAESSS
jgi:uncharacterized membrane protein YbhN (UPF0104 family)